MDNVISSMLSTAVANNTFHYIGTFTNVRGLYEMFPFFVCVERYPSARKHS